LLYKHNLKFCYSHAGRHFVNELTTKKPQKLVSVTNF